MVIGFLALAFGYLELAFRESFLGLFNGDEYLRLNYRNLFESGYWIRELQETGRVIRDFSEAFYSDLFNFSYFSDLGLRMYRVHGPSFHSISFAYGLVLCLNCAVCS